MSLLKSLLANNFGSMQKMSLNQAAQEAPNRMGVYTLYLHNRPVYVGKAEDGIRKRMVQYKNGTTVSYSSGQRIYNNRDDIKVTWQVCNSREQCRKVEQQKISSIHPEWNRQRGWGDDKIYK